MSSEIFSRSRPDRFKSITAAPLRSRRRTGVRLTAELSDRAAQCITFLQLHSRFPSLSKQYIFLSEALLWFDLARKLCRKLFALPLVSATECPVCDRPSAPGGTGSMRSESPFPLCRPKRHGAYRRRTASRVAQALAADRTKFIKTGISKPMEQYAHGCTPDHSDVRYRPLRFTFAFGTG